MAELKTLFGAMLRRHRKQSGLSQVELAEKVGVSLETIARVERGTSGASFEVVERMATALGVTPAALFGVDTSHDPQGRLNDILIKLSRLSATELTWVDELVELALRRPR